ncbi:MAG TPA: DegV family protein [Acidimicrobiales bacterium]|nr:DegV family protein [Acidimicrobiales bacterium]|tara:strand:+ start:2059 stop:2895 length:837 start_codon:yes stop_codon:yes gene_type:complete
MTVRIVTDSACDLSEEETTALDIDVVPLSIRFGEVEYIDRQELSVPDFYKEMSSSEHLPQTAAPAPGAFGEIFTNRLNAGAESVVCINLSSGVSATMQSAQTGAQESGGDVRVVDSYSVSAGQGTIVLAAANAAKNGASADEIMALVSDLSSRTRVYGALDTLENLKKGGRVGNAAALFGSVLSIKPLIDISSGVVEEAGRQRTRKKALAWLVEKVKDHQDNLESLSVAHAMAPDIDLFADELHAVTNLDEIRVSVIGPVVASHGGPGLVAISFVLKN